MKRILSVGLLTVCALAFSEHQAQAWVNSKFSIGLNFHQQSANTSYLWGFWRNGQIPGPEAFGPGGPTGVMPGYSVPSNPPFPFMGGTPLMSGIPQAAPQNGAFNLGAYPQSAYYMPQGYPMGYPQANFQPQTPPANFFVDGPAQMPYMPNMPNMRSNPFQAVNYQAQGYYYPAYGYDVPYYWYGSAR